MTRNLTLLAATAVFAATFGGVAHASPAPLGTPAASIAAAPPAPPTDPSQLAVARQFVDVMAEQMNYPALLKQLNTQVLGMMRARSPHVTQAEVDGVSELVTRVETEKLPELKDDLARLYAQHLTRQEMQDAMAFYASPSGRSYLQKMPGIVGGMGPAMNNWVPDVARAIAQALCPGDSCSEGNREMARGLTTES